MDGQDDAKGGRYLKYRPGWTVFQIPSTPGCLRAVGSVLCGSDWKHLNPRLLLFLFEIDLERRLPHQSRAAAGGRGPAVVRWLTRKAATCSLRRRLRPWGGWTCPRKCCVCSGFRRGLCWCREQWTRRLGWWRSEAPSARIDAAGNAAITELLAAPETSIPGTRSGGSGASARCLASRPCQSRNSEDMEPWRV